MAEYRNVLKQELHRDLFRGFVRRQTVTKCWRKEHGTWIIKEDPFVDDWTEHDYQVLISALRDTVAQGGFVYAAFCGDIMKGFVSVESALFGGQHQYLDMSNLHVSEDMRGQGIGTALFLAAKAWAKKNGARKLYLSAHSAVESQAFYHKMGCVEAAVYQQKHVEAEPYDCQMECLL